MDESSYPRRIAGHDSASRIFCTRRLSVVAADQLGRLRHPTRRIQQGLGRDMGTFLVALSPEQQPRRGGSESSKRTGDQGGGKPRPVDGPYPSSVAGILQHVKCQRRVVNQDVIRRSSLFYRPQLPLAICVLLAKRRGGPRHIATNDRTKTCYNKAARQLPELHLGTAVRIRLPNASLPNAGPTLGSSSRLGETAFVLGRTPSSSPVAAYCGATVAIYDRSASPRWGRRRRGTREHQPDHGGQLARGIRQCSPPERMNDRDAVRPARGS